MKPPDYSSGGSVIIASPTSYSHMPNQSSNISSSNQHRLDGSSGSYAAQLPTYAKNYHSAGMNVSHQHVPNHHEQVTTTLQPIVIQPLPEQNGQHDYAFTVSVFSVSRFPLCVACECEFQFRIPTAHHGCFKM